MSGKIICIWGSPSSGKTVLSLALAAKFAEKKKNVIVYNGDRLIPALKMYVPSKQITSKESVGPLLMSEKYDDDTFLSHMVFHPETEYIGFMGMAPDENYITYHNFSKESVIKLMNKMTVKADYVIIDGVSNPLDDTMTLTALELADIKIRMITADAKGMLYNKAIESMYRDERFGYDNHIKILGNIKKIAPVSEVTSLYGPFDYNLPYTYEVENRMNEGSLMGNFGRFKGMNFEKQVRKLAERIEKT